MASENVEVKIKLSQAQAGKLYMKAMKLEDKVNEIKTAWGELIGNTTEPDAFGNVIIPEVDHAAFHKLINDL